MAWVELVSLLAVFQFFAFGGLVARARSRYGVKAPATVGHEMFERYYRVQMNTMETLIIFLPALWIAALYWSPALMAGVGAAYLVGRLVYLRGYVADPAKRSMGFAISVAPAGILLLASVVGAIRSLLI